MNLESFKVGQFVVITDVAYEMSEGVPMTGEVFKVFGIYPPFLAVENKNKEVFTLDSRMVDIQPVANKRAAKKLFNLPFLGYADKDKEKQSAALSPAQQPNTTTAQFGTVCPKCGSLEFHVTFHRPGVVEQRAVTVSCDSCKATNTFAPV